MKRAEFQFFAELNDFLPKAQQGIRFPYAFQDHPTVKHSIESLGIPHTEVFAIRANDHLVDFSYQIQHGDFIRVYPPSQAGEINPETVVFERPEHCPRFILDTHLGRLAAYLRMLGFDTWYRNDYEDEELAQLAGDTGRVLLTRDRRLLMRSRVRFGICIRSLTPEEQVVEVLERYRLFDKITPFKRCLRCNHPLSPIAKETVLDRLEPLTRLYFDKFHYCPACEQIYWKGSHYERMKDFIQRVSQETPGD